MKLRYKIFFAFLLLCLCLPFSARVLGLFFKGKILDAYAFSQAFYDRRGRLMRLALSYDDKYRLFVPLKELPAEFKEAVLLYEDRHFYRHFGFNPAALLKAGWVSFVKKNRRQGASTITMQTARMLYDIDSRSMRGKLKQILAALWLEIRYTKDEILEAYLNIAPYGYNIEGAGAASLIYFNTRAQEMALLEAAALAVIPQNPKERVPARAGGFENMKTARAALYKEWLKKHPGDKKFSGFFKMPMSVKDPSKLPFEAPHLIAYLQAREKASEVFTSVDIDMQRGFEEQIKTYVSRNKVKGITNASALLVNYKTMEAEAAVGSADFWDDSISGQVNGIAAKRLIASTLKPFIYAMALDNGLIHPATLLKDTPRRFGIYSPENADRNFAGPVLAKDALNASRNIPAIELLLAAGPQGYISLLKKGGVSGLKDAEYYGIGLAIGTFEVTPTETAGLYAALANGGYYGAVSFLKGGARREKLKLFSPEAAFITLDMLKDTAGARPKIKGSVGKNAAFYFKTGTSSSFKDAWTAGVFGDYVLVVWVGNFSGEGNNYFWGRLAALPLFYELAEIAAKNRPGADFGPLSREGLNITLTDVCKGTGDLPGRYCPATEKTYFIPGVSPIKISDIHRLVYLDTATGLRACRHAPGKTKGEVLEFWPSEIEALFKAAGIMHRPVPRYVEGCAMEEVYEKGFAPEIILPVKEITYSFRQKDMEKEIIPLKAQTDKDANTVYWFVDNKFMGAVPAGQTLFIRPKNGVYNVRATDDLGRAGASVLSMALEAD